MCKSKHTKETPVFFDLEELLHSETALSKKIENLPSWEVVENLRKLGLMLDKIRERIGIAVGITSGFRCKKLNKAVGGSSTSQHLEGEAADCVCADNKLFFDTAKEMMDNGEIEVGQLIWEYGTKTSPDWVHISIPNLERGLYNQVLYIGV